MDYVRDGVFFLGSPWNRRDKLNQCGNSRVGQEPRGLQGKKSRRTRGKMKVDHGGFFGKKTVMGSHRRYPERAADGNYPKSVLELHARKSPKRKGKLPRDVSVQLSSVFP